MSKLNKNKLKNLVKEITGDFQSQTDPSGSYTGTPDGIDVVPVQDADDL